MGLAHTAGLLAVLVASTGCAADVGTATPRDPFIALARDLDGFRSWPNIFLEEPFTLDGGHRVGTSHVFVNGEVPPDGQPFALGTILVKTVEDGDPSTWEIHAMVKRGGGYNAAGAIDWEWLDVALTDAGEPIIAWRGEGSAADPGAYVTASGENIPCNSCHVYAMRRDYAFSRLLLRDAGL